MQLADRQAEAVAPHRPCIMGEIEQPHVDLIVLAVAGQRAIDHVVELLARSRSSRDETAGGRRISDTGAITSNQRKRASAAAISWLSEKREVLLVRSSGWRGTAARRRAGDCGPGGRGGTCRLARRAAAARRRARLAARTCADRLVERVGLGGRLDVERRLQRLAAARIFAQRLRALAHVGERPHQHARGALVGRHRSRSGGGRSIGDARSRRRIPMRLRSLSSASSSCAQLLGESACARRAAIDRTRC